MIGRDILEGVFGISFPKGTYLKVTESIDAQGMFGRKQTNTILIKLCEQIDVLNDEIKELKNQVTSLGENVGKKGKSN